MLSERRSITVTLINNLNADLKCVVYVVATDAKGRIVGGGSAQSGNIRANSSVSVQVPILFLGKPEEIKFDTSVGIPLDVTIGS